MVISRKRFSRKKRVPFAVAPSASSESQSWPARVQQGARRVTRPRSGVVPLSPHRCFQMASRSKIRASIKEITNKRPAEHQICDAIDRLANQSDLSAAVVSCALVEHSLQLALLTYFIPMNGDEQMRLFDGNGTGALADFSAKIAIGYALGIYDDAIRDDLNIIKSIRNSFAHATEDLKFSTQEIADCVGLFNFSCESEWDDARHRYLLTVSYYMGVFAGITKGRSSKPKTFALLRSPR